MSGTRDPYRIVSLENAVSDEQSKQDLRALNKESWEPEKARLEVASRLASILLIVFGFAVVYSGIVISILAFRYSNPDDSIQQMRDFFNMLLPYVATPLGIALGYFFSESRG